MKSKKSKMCRDCVSYFGMFIIQSKEAIQHKECLVQISIFFLMIFLVPFNIELLFPIQKPNSLKSMQRKVRKPRIGRVSVVSYIVHIKPKRTHSSPVCPYRISSFAFLRMLKEDKEWEEILEKYQNESDSKR